MRVQGESLERQRHPPGCPTGLCAVGPLSSSDIFRSAQLHPTLCEGVRGNLSGAQAYVSTYDSKSTEYAVLLLRSKLTNRAMARPGHKCGWNLGVARR